MKNFPHALRVNGVVHEVNTDFRVGLKIMEAFEDPRLTSFEKQAVMCGLLFQIVPEDYNEACRMAVKFLDCGKERSDEPVGNRVYSFTRDFEFIYAAFLQTYGVDLREAKLHWWKFCAMFSDLRESTTFERIVSLRSRKDRGQLTKEERQLWSEMRHILDLNIQPPDDETLRARENFEKLLRG